MAGSPLTVTGGADHPAVSLDFDANDRARLLGEALASMIDGQYSATQASVYGAGGNPASGYVIVPSGTTGPVDVTGAGAVAVQDTAPLSVTGGSATGQTVLAGDGGLAFSAAAGSTTVVAGGGANSVSFAGSIGSNAAYLSTGNDTVAGGDGASTSMPAAAPTWCAPVPAPAA